MIVRKNHRYSNNLSYIGDRVFTAGTKTGTYAEYCVASSNSVFHLPSSLSFEQGSALGVPYFTAYRALVIK